MLVDTGIYGDKIIDAADDRFGAATQPRCMILTHEHFDHAAGSVAGSDLSRTPLEFPFLSGGDSYPDPDPMVGDGLMTLTSPMFPKDPIDISDALRKLPVDGTVPELPGPQWHAIRF